VKTGIAFFAFALVCIAIFAAILVAGTIVIVIAIGAVHLFIGMPYVAISALCVGEPSAPFIAILAALVCWLIYAIACRAHVLPKRLRGPSDRFDAKLDAWLDARSEAQLLSYGVSPECLERSRSARK
jgi:hypothetical protein